MPAPVSTPLPPRLRIDRLKLTLAILSIAAASVAAFLWKENRALRAAAPVASTLVNELLIRPGQATRLVAADSGQLLLQKMRGRESTLKQYIDRDFSKAAAEFSRQPVLYGIAEHLEKVAHTGVAEVAVFARVLKQNPGAVTRVEVRHARDMTVRDFKQGNYLILGSPRANPWCALFEEKTTFHTEFDPVRGKVVITNSAPRPGEPALWWDHTAREQYAHVALVPNLSGNGKVLLAAGTSMSAKEAGGDFITDPEVPAQLARTFGVNDLRQLASFEVVLRSRSLDGTPQGWHIVASRSK
jgi:hypothetical protein